MKLPPADREFAFSDQDFKFLAQMANQHSGIVVSENKRDMVYARLARRLRALGLSSFAEYCNLLQSDEGSDEIGQLVNAITTNLTSFFREGHHFEHMKDTILLPMLQDAKSKRLRIWSSACSSGMEPYSIAMTIKDAIPSMASWDIRILATDIDTHMLETGRKGTYSISEYDRIPARYQRFVDADTKAGTIQVRDDIRDMVVFRPLNLLEAWPMKGSFDAIFCRNVVIYFDKPTKETLFDRMADIIKPQGWLYIGHSENLHNITDRFALTGRTIYRETSL